MRQTLLGLFVFVALATAADEPKSNWSGLLYKNGVSQLPDRIEKKFKQAPFVCGILLDAKSFEKFLEATAKGPRKPETFWGAWKTTIDWKKEAVAYVVLATPTNKLTYQSCKSRPGETTLDVAWSGIEPFYGDYYPAVFARVSRTDLKRLIVQVDGTTLAEVPLPKV